VPTALDHTLDRLPPGTRIFNDYALGGWISWRHPDLEQYIDGLITPYSAAHAHDYVVAEDADRGWLRVIDASKARVALINQDSPLAHRLAGRGWTRQGADGGYVLLTAPGVLTSSGAV
jgi:hypothetical protein